MLTIVPEAVEVPGRCAISQSTTGPFVDSNVVIPRHGRLYLSVPYLNSIAGDLGWVPAPELEAALTALDDAYASIEPLASRVERFDEDVQNVADAMASFSAEVLTSEPAAPDVALILDELDSAKAEVEGLRERIAILEAAPED